MQGKNSPVSGVSRSRAVMAVVAHIILWTSTADPVHAGGDCPFTFNDRVAYGVGAFPVHVSIGDVNGDSHKDLATANASSASISILLNVGNGTFSTHVTYGVGVQPHGIAVGDFDGDGDQDLAVANRSGDSISILLNMGNGTFAPQVIYPVGDGPISIASADLDGDGDPDLVTANSSSSNISVLYNNGDGTFAPHETIAVGLAPYSVAIGYLDPGNVFDVVVANAGGNSVTILHNIAGGAPASYVRAVGSSPQSVVITDVSADGFNDLAVANTGGFSNSVSVLLNNGDGTFAAPHIQYGVGSTPRSVAAADLNDDGFPDLVTANLSGATVSVLMNAGTGNGTFLAQKTYAAGDAPRSVALDDLNGDGLPDLAVANSSSPSVVSVLVNRGDSASGDGNGDGRTDGEDIQGFVLAALAGGGIDPSNCAYDMNADGMVGSADVSLFIMALIEAQ